MRNKTREARYQPGSSAPATVVAQRLPGPHTSTIGVWGKAKLSVASLDHRGRKLSVQTIRGGWAKVVEELGRVRKPLSICFEASSGYVFLFGKLQSIARRVVVAHPGKLRLIFRSSRKNDRANAEKLAKLLFLDEVPPVHVPSVEVRSWHSMIEHRRKLVAEGTRIKNTIRGLLRSQGVEAPRSLCTGRGLKWLGFVQLGTELDNLQRDILRERLQLLTSMVKRVEHVLNRMASEHPGVMLLRTIPGVGPRIAEAVVAYIDAPHRFHRNKAIGSYFGLVPRQDASGRSNQLGHITREGPSLVRCLLVQAVWVGIRRCQRIRAMLAMLQTGEVWRYSAETV